ncbi:MAG: sulfide/dihydroorotate dehydrogenase-like FAD/NAD-binding protein [Clostridium sp.]|nr:sulfide/dihydroorotate dehydrogenase-like FAD/NAD-binding protein [Clostridium sp.]
MGYEPYNCIDCGSEYCPCHLAESGNCILCSHLDGKDFCDCVNWNGVCIYQEFVQNNYKAKPGRKHQKFPIIYKKIINENLLLLKIKVTKKLASELVEPGSFIFIRNPNNEQIFDTPICVMDSNTDLDILTLAIELKGLKTKSLLSLEVNDEILVKGPFWNGIMGVNSIKTVKNKHCLLICRGIGQAPMVPVMEKLHNNGNDITVVLDEGTLKTTFIQEALDKYAKEVIRCNILIFGGLLDINFRKILEGLLVRENISLVHCDSADIVSNQVMKIVEAHDKEINFSCSNNEKMCCGEGVCGCCTIMNDDEKLRRLCKMQTIPHYIFEGRRLL